MSAGPSGAVSTVIPNFLQQVQQMGPDKGPLFTPPGPAIRPTGPDKGPLFVPPGPAIRPGDPAAQAAPYWRDTLSPTDPTRLADPSKPWQLRMAEPLPQQAVAPVGGAQQPIPQQPARMGGLLGAFNPPRYFQ